MDQATLIDYFGARGTVDVHLPSVDPFAAHPKSERPEPAVFFNVFRDPSTVCVQGVRQIFHQCRKQPLARFGSSSLQHSAQSGIHIEVVKRQWVHHQIPSIIPRLARQNILGGNNEVKTSKILRCCISWTASTLFPSAAHTLR